MELLILADGVDYSAFNEQAGGKWIDDDGEYVGPTMSQALTVIADEVRRSKGGTS
ncbi:MAG TPA: hypothetical protein VG476_02480 [Acidimicrobiales bacterium]|nr:hypothetical protein [Acidimicrobiales bacterium]